MSPKHAFIVKDVWKGYNVSISAPPSSHGVVKASCVTDRCASHNGCHAVNRKHEKASCRHYHLQDDECNMTPKLQVERSLPFLSFSVIRIGGLNSSVILTSLDYNNYTGKLLSYLEPVFLSLERSRFVKCWHAKTDGWAASTFHSNCDGRGPTVTIIKVKDYIFGGYTDVSWSSKYILATKFFFSVQGLKDLEGQRINVGGIWSSLVSKTEKKYIFWSLFLEILGDTMGPKLYLVIQVHPIWFRLMIFSSFEFQNYP